MLLDIASPLDDSGNDPLETKATHPTGTKTPSGWVAFSSVKISHDIILEFEGGQSTGVFFPADCPPLLSVK